MKGPPRPEDGMLGDGEEAVRPDSGVSRAALFGRLVHERLDAAYRLARTQDEGEVWG
ncbi:MAG: hypothetical protein ABR509_07255 [Candidatus Limnocylindria bacterium]